MSMSKKKKIKTALVYVRVCWSVICVCVCGLSLVCVCGLSLVCVCGLSLVCVCNNNNNVHLSCARQRPERSHDTY